MAADVGFGDAGDEVARHAEVADFDLALGVDEDVRGFYVAMDDVVVVF